MTTGRSNHLMDRLDMVVRERPGIMGAEARSQLCVGTSAFSAALRSCRARGSIATTRLGRALLLHPAWASPPPDSAERILLQQVRARELAVEIARTPFHSAASLSRTLGTSLRTTYYNLHALRNLGLITSERGRHFRDLAPTRRLLDHLHRLPQSAAPMLTDGVA